MQVTTHCFFTVTDSMQLLLTLHCYSMPTLYSDVELSTRDNTVEQIDSRAESFMEESIRPKVRQIVIFPVARMTKNA